MKFVLEAHKTFTMESKDNVQKNKKKTIEKKKLVWKWKIMNKSNGIEIEIQLNNRQNENR
jgi:hypothetical protein